MDTLGWRARSSEANDNVSISRVTTQIQQNFIKCQTTTVERFISFAITNRFLNSIVIDLDLVDSGQINKNVINAV